MPARLLPLTPFLRIAPRHALHNRWPAGQEYTGIVSGNPVFWLVTRGRVEVQCERGHWTLEGGTTFLFALIGKRRILAHEDSEWYSIGLRATAYDSLDLFPLLPLPSLWKPTDSDFNSLENACSSISREWGGPQYAAVEAGTFGNYLHNQGSNPLEYDAARALICEGAASTIFAHCWRRWSQQSLEETIGHHLPYWMPTALSRLRAEPGIGVDELAHAVGVSRRHLTRQFQASFGMPPREFLNRRRLEEARQLLENTDVPLAEVARQTGFGDVAYFNRLFKNTYGFPPETFRQRVRAQTPEF